MTIKPPLAISLFLCFSLSSCGGGVSSEDVPSSPPIVVQDSDGDGVNDDLDTCANTPAGDTVDANGCSLPIDSDNDGVNDDIDQCANTPAGDTVDANGCSLPVDNDSDGVNDDLDQCANTPAGDTVDANGCSLPVDSDNDGVNDDLDQCANTPAGDTVDANGCSLPVDSDNDGVNDDVDICPNTPADKTVDAQGCEVQTGGNVSVLVQAEDYTNYYDTTPGNTGGAYRSDDVDIEVTTDNDGGHNVGFIVANEFLEYSLDLPAGIYAISARIASEVSSGEYSVSLNEQVVGTASVSATGGWQTFITQTLGSIKLSSAAIYTLKVNAIAGDFNINWLLIETVFDGDNDGIIDDSDLCPNTPNGDVVDKNGCTVVIPPADSDGDNDGVSDSNDLCANTPSGVKVDANGCALALDGIEVTSANDILVGGSASPQPGYALYVFDGDLSVPGASACNGDCADNWPPLLVTDGLPSGISGLGTIDLNNGEVQVTYNDRPLYHYINDNNPGDTNGDSITGWHIVPFASLSAIEPLYNETTQLEPVVSFVRNDGVVVTRFGDRGRDRHAKDIGMYDPNNIFNSDHYDHWLAHYWEYRTARVQFEDFVPNGRSLIRATYITEAQLGAREFRVWFFGLTTTGQFHWNPEATYLGKGTWNNDFVKVSEAGNQHMYTVDITEQWKKVATFNTPLKLGVNMEFEISQFLLAPPAGVRKNYYGTSYVYKIGTPGVSPFEWQRGVQDELGVNDGTPIPAKGLSGGATTLGYNYSEEPAGRFIEMATNLSPGNAQPFVRGRRVHHTNFEDGSHDERNDNPIWSEQIGKAGNHYINQSCANCHVRNGRALVEDVGNNLTKWVFKVGDVDGNPDPLIGSVLQPNQTGSASPEGTVMLNPWTELSNGLRSPNYVFSNGEPARFSARIAPQLVGVGLLEAIDESTILEWAEQDNVDHNGNGITGRASLVSDPETGKVRLGRFGYKAATASVRHQVASALNTDIGVMTSALPDPDCGREQTGCGESGAELADEQLNDLVKYMSLLGVGARRDYENTSGETVFSDIGCGDCHRESMTTSDYHPLTELRSQTIYPYTDLLLHDMGPGLADNLGQGIATGAEWRTAALWGLGHSRAVMLGDAKANDEISKAQDSSDVDRIGYLHDGRARTLDEAIRWHGGEGESSKLAFEALSETDKTTLLDFLKSL